MTTKFYLFILLLFIFFQVQGQDTLFVTDEQIRDCTTKTLALLQEGKVCIYATRTNNMMTFCQKDTISFDKVWHLEGDTDFGFLGIQTTNHRNYIIVLHKGRAHALTYNLGQNIEYILKKQYPNGNTALIFKASFRELIMEGNTYVVLLFNPREQTYQTKIINGHTRSLDVKTGEVILDDKYVNFEFIDNTIVIHEHNKSVMK